MESTRWPLCQARPPARSTPRPGTLPVHDALVHLYDPGYLETHSLGDLRGRALHRALLDAVDALKPPPGAPADGRARRPHELLRLRYVEALPVEEVQRRLTIGRSEYYREHDRALEAVTTLLGSRAGLDTRAVPSGHELADAGAPAPVGTSSPGRLPIALTSFVGRDDELVEIEHLLRTSRLVTLTGAGGCGKTRLARRRWWPAPAG